VVFSPDGRWLATVGDVEAVQTVRVWEVSTGKLVRTLAPAFAPPMGSVAFSPDGHWLAAAGGVPLGSKELTSYDVIRIWDFSTGRESLSITRPFVGITSLVFDPAGHALVAATYDGVHVLDATTGRELHTFRTKSPTDTYEANGARSVAYSPDGRWLAVGNEDHVVRIWDAKTGRELLDLESHTKPVRAIAFSPDGQRLVSASDGIRLWRIWKMQ
jgi:WD40 repeat protein